MPQFHETGYGRRFFDSQLPDLIEAIRELGSQTARQNVLIERHIDLLEQQEAYSVVRDPSDVEFDQIKLAAKLFANGTQVDVDMHSVGLGTINVDKLLYPDRVLAPGDPVQVRGAKGITGYDVALGEVSSNNEVDQIIKVDFLADPGTGHKLKPRWIPAEYVFYDDNPR